MIKKRPSNLLNLRDVEPMRKFPPTRTNYSIILNVGVGVGVRVGVKVDV
jgi:hypothetical protein